MRDKVVNKKMVLILLSIAHICCLVIFVIYMYTGTQVMEYDNETASRVISVEPEYKEVETLPQTEQETELQSETQTVAETEIDTETQTEIETETETEEPFSGTFTVVTEAYRLNMRKEPSVNSDIIGKLPKGSTGTVLEIVNNYWALIEYNGTQGYCNTEYLQIE
jgi:hypothetical protein